MSNSEDYLDGLLNSISEAKTNVKNAAAREERRRAERVARRTRINPEDNFMDATGISGYEPRRVSRKNLREAFSESDFLKDFEDELLEGEEDDGTSLVDDFEQEIAADFGLDMGNEEEGDSSFEEDELDFEDSTDFEPQNEEKSDDLQQDSETGSDDEEPLELDDLAELEEEPLELEESLVEGESLEENDSEEEPLELEKSEESEESHELNESEDSQGAEEEEESEEPLELEESLDLEEPLEMEEPSENEDSDSSVDDILSMARMKMDEDSEEEESILQPEFQPDELDEESAEGSDSSSAAVDESDPLPLDDLSEIGIDSLPLGEDVDLPELLDENGDSDLMDFLGEDSDLSDIGDLLESDENNIELQEARDFYEAGVDGVSLDAFDEVTETPEAKGLLGKIQKFFHKLFEHKDNDPTGDHTVEIIDNMGPEDLSGENADILKEFEGEDGETLDPKAAKAEAKKQAKAEKEKKKKEAAAEKEKKKKEAAEAKKRKAEEKAKAKANKPKDNSPKIPIKAFIPFILLAVSIIVLVMVATNVLSAHKAETMAKKYFDNGQYEQAYKEIGNMTFKDEEDINFQESVHLMAELQMKYNRYQSFMTMKKYDLALDELVNGYGRYNFNAATAAGLGIGDAYDAMAQTMAGQLMDQFGVTTDQALELYNIHDRKDYTKAIIEVVENLGMKVENQYE